LTILPISRPNGNVGWSEHHPLSVEGANHVGSNVAIAIRRGVELAD